MVEKDGSWRMCVDYRKMNEKTIKDAYPLTRIDENLDTLDGADWYTSLDLDMAYHQVPITDEDKEKRLLLLLEAVYISLRSCPTAFAMRPVHSKD